MEAFSGNPIDFRERKVMDGSNQSLANQLDAVKVQHFIKEPIVQKLQDLGEQERLGEDEPSAQGLQQSRKGQILEGSRSFVQEEHNISGQCLIGENQFVSELQDITDTEIPSSSKSSVQDEQDSVKGVSLECKEPCVGELQNSNSVQFGSQSCVVKVPSFIDSFISFIDSFSINEGSSLRGEASYVAELEDSQLEGEHVPVGGHHESGKRKDIEEGKSLALHDISEEQMSKQEGRKNLKGKSVTDKTEPSRDQHDMCGGICSAPTRDASVLDLKEGNDNTFAKELLNVAERQSCPSSDDSVHESPRPDNVGELEYNQSLFLSTAEVKETWNDRMKKLISGLVGLVNPEGIPVGKIISALINFFWPNSAVDIWDLVKDQVEYMIDQKILAAETDQLRNSLDGLKQTMQQYVEAKPHEKGSLMSAIITACNDLHSRLVNSKNAVHLIPLTVTLSYMHLAILKERLLHGKEIYDEDNTKIWQTDLEQGIETYKKEFHTIYLKWREWRSDSIIVTTGEYKTFTTVIPFYFYSYKGNVNDKITGYNRDFIYHTTLTVSDPDFFKEICDIVKEMVWKRANGAMLQTLLPTFFLANFKPGNEDNPSNPDPEMKTAAFGPFSHNVLSGNGHDSRCVIYPCFDNPNDTFVTQVNVSEWNLIDGLKFNYNGTWGTFVGNPGGGQLHEIEAKGRLVHNVKFGFNNQGMVDIEIIFSDGQTSGKLGNRGGWSASPAEAGWIDSFGLKNVKMAGSKGVSHIELFFEHVTCQPSDLK